MPGVAGLACRAIRSQRPVGLCAELIVVLDLEEWLLLRRGEKPGPAEAILPDRHHVAGKTGARGAAFEGCTQILLLPRRLRVKGSVEKHDDQLHVLDVQVCNLEGSRALLPAPRRGAFLPALEQHIVHQGVGALRGGVGVGAQIGFAIEQRVREIGRASCRERVSFGV